MWFAIITAYLAVAGCAFLVLYDMDGDDRVQGLGLGAVLIAIVALGWAVVIAGLLVGSALDLLSEEE